ncbi:molybdenum cofactor biosynthesis protein MoaE [Oceaniglobus indicus]|uniref:molybdenum cofactor biosynthesis protein MoaE n=1 Tax=Oceaniglobus indicus TaxID=2047749 RepID=UPI000C18B688|nr:molybdenum cofactor biosynthesis protein MoaE [Oceaniglobus indicus]
MSVRVQSDPFDPGAALNGFVSAQANAGAVVSFSGIVRDRPEGGLQHMEIEHYPAMTAGAISAIVDQAVARFGLDDALVIHRHGILKVGEVIMMVATSARHRADAFQGAEFLMDYLKSRAPFWKKEVTGDGASWVAARDVDEAALDRW